MVEAVLTKTVEPIRRAFPAEKIKAWHYKIHPYHTKQPSNVVGEYIRHFCPDGGLVVDPFCGSGVTAIEALTNRLSALERFVALLSATPELSKTRQLTIVAPKARRRKVQQELTSSSYIGHPQYLENKITYMFYDDLKAAFSKYGARRTIHLEELHRFCQLPPSLEGKFEGA